MALRPRSNITGKPAIPTPGRLDLPVIQQFANNVRERFRQVDTEAAYLRSLADNATSGQSVASLGAAVSVLQSQVAALAQQIGGAISAEAAFDPPPPQVPSVRAGLLIDIARDAAGYTISVDPVPAAIFGEEFGG